LFAPADPYESIVATIIRWSGLCTYARYVDVLGIDDGLMD